MAFDFITDKFEREALEEAYKAIESVGAWAFMAEDPGEGGFMFSKNPMLEEINKAMKDVGHSGSSYGWTMRQMQYIARHGLEAYKTMRSNQQV